MDVDIGLRASRRPHADARLLADARGRDGGVREGLGAEVVQLKPTTEVEATSIVPSLNVKTHDSHHRTAGIAGRTRWRSGRMAARGARAQSERVRR